MKKVKVDKSKAIVTPATLDILTGLALAVAVIMCLYWLMGLVL